MIKDLFILRDDITYLNFGAFGACAKPVFSYYQELQRELEEEPTLFILEKGMSLLKEAREALGKFINCDADDLVYIPNPTYAANIIAKSWPLKPGDEILTTDLEYGGIDRTWDYYCKKAGATFKRMNTTFPIESEDSFVEDFVKGFNSKTKLLFISHITSSTALKLPIEKIMAYAKSKGIPTFIDGAHCAGHIPIDIKALDPDIYIGACHKWMMTPKGSSFLYVKKELQYLFDPLVISWGYNSPAPSHSQYLDYHQTQGTRDYTAFLTIPKAIDFIKKHNWTTQNVYCHNLARENAERLHAIFDAEPLAPLDSSYRCQMISIPFLSTNPVKLYRELFDRFKIRGSVQFKEEKSFFRYSIQAFNTQEDLDKLYDALLVLKNEGYF
jgi:isopenicillin-N epimerase